MKDLNEKRKELSLTLAKMHMGKEKNLKKAKFLKKEIARILTKQNMKGDKRK